MLVPLQGAAAGCGCRMLVADMCGRVGVGAWMPVKLQGAAARSRLRRKRATQLGVACTYLVLFGSMLA